MKPWEWFNFPWRTYRGRTLPPPQHPSSPPPTHTHTKVKSSTWEKNNMEGAGKELNGDERGTVTEVGRKVKKKDILEAKGEKSFNVIMRYGAV